MKLERLAYLNLAPDMMSRLVSVVPCYTVLQASKLLLIVNFQKTQGYCHINNVWLVNSLSSEAQQTLDFVQL